MRLRTEPPATPGTVEGEARGGWPIARLPLFGTPSSWTFKVLLGPLVLCASAGVQLTLAALLLADPALPRTEPLTAWGRMFFLPEREVDLYVAGVSASLLLWILVAAAWAGALRSGRMPSRRRRNGALAARLGAAAAGTLWFLLMWMNARDDIVAGRDPHLTQLVLFGALGLATLAASAPVELIGRRPAREGSDPTESSADSAQAQAPPPAPEPSRVRLSVPDLLVPAVVFLLVYVPGWRLLAGRFFLTDAFFHWDYFVMGPALAVEHGRALGADSYAMYGVGWPAFFGRLSTWIPLTYGRVIQVSSLYGCLYFCGVYLMLRLLLRRPWLAAVGTGIAMLHLFLAMADAVVWVLPSVSVLRWTFDVWCFIALVLHRNTGRRIWALMAGISVGLALGFSIDTGMYLAAAAAFYWICSAWGDRTGAFRRLDAVWLVVGGAVGLTGVLAAAAGETIFSRPFWNGWLEPLRDYRGGFAQVPLTTVDDSTIVVVALLVGIYLVVAGRCLVKVLYRVAGLRDLFAGTFAVYGLMNLIHFAGRSVNASYYRLTLPMAFILALLLEQLYSRAETAGLQRWGSGVRRLIPAAATGALALVVLLGVLATPPNLLLNPVRSYPNLVYQAVHPKQPQGLCLLQDPVDVCGLPLEFGGAVDRFQSIAASLRTLEERGYSVAIIDESGSILYLAGGQEPFGRYPRMFLNMYSKRNEDKVLADLTQRRPDYVLTREPLVETDPFYRMWAYFGVGPREDTPYPDVWGHLLGYVRSNYRLQERMSPFELWALEPTPDP